MPHSANKSKKSAAGTGTIRKKAVTRNGKEYTFWEARFTTGYDPGTGKQIQRSITGKTQKEVAQKMKAALAELDSGTYIAPCKMTVGEWLDIWSAEYLGNVKPGTKSIYLSAIQTHIKPGLGAIKLEALNAHTIQSFYNKLVKPANERPALAPKSVKNIHGILHKALQQAIANGYIRTNPTDACILPRIVKKELKPLDETQISAFLKAIQGHRFEDLFLVTLFTGMREGEVLGLTWDCVDFSNGTILINKQLQKVRNKPEYQLVTTKNGKSRSVTPASFVMETLQRVQRTQQENRLRYGELLEDSGFVFTDELGQHLKHRTVYNNFKVIASKIGSPETRFHDLRHSYAVASIRSGDDIKTVQENLGHATAAFTLDVYGHVTEKMKQESAARMQQFIQAVNQPIRETKAVR